jgi:hypothetical protein
MSMDMNHRPSHIIRLVAFIDISKAFEIHGRWVSDQSVDFVYVSSK